MNQEYLLSSFTYKVASWVEDTDPIGFVFFEMDFKEPNIQKKLYKFNKDTILHEYIFTYIYTFMLENIRANPDNFIPDDEPVPYELEYLFGEYKVKYSPFTDFVERNKTEDEEIHDLLFDWVIDQGESFAELWGQIADEVFFLLFSNRRFLMKFHLALAEYIKDGNIEIDKKYLRSNGKIKRSNIPSWAKKAVYCRDKARCVLCNKDLSGTLSTDRKMHYDHIVALNLNGVNDPTNLQLLCEKCNLKKSGNIVNTTVKYPAWW